jgi:hypothetical protein
VIRGGCPRTRTPRRAGARAADRALRRARKPLRALAGILVGTTTILAPAAPLAADTIYLANGRVIHTESARIEENRVVFRQFGGEVSIPRAAVARVVGDDKVERVSEKAPGPLRDAGSGVAVVVPEAPSHASQNPEYWIERIQDVDERIARVEAELARLPSYDEVDRRLLRFSGQALYFMAERDKWEAMLRDFQATRRGLLEAARRAGITPGALRNSSGR